ncbi:serine hydrolase domain-containing protein [Ferruginibacter paludis]|uniref:serine hydrolase domain-containing protein n=1 Tax=Ferruginibacter paludis TaxID=1310417 RepID=UPI0025B42843|nr:serine hydrolase domain-containing protein [Ferruginibacter paludis]MDN3658183.1 serine hydrolase domain-containing protein [Ferruginibacter paludis]
MMRPEKILKIVTLKAFLLCTLCSDAQLVKKLDSLLFQQSKDQPGFALSIEQDGKSLYNNQLGLAVLEGAKEIDAGTNFRMASITKQFTAMGILLLEKSHQLSVNDAIGRWLPGLPAGVGSRVHISHLLTHSSGILDYEELMPASQTKQLLDADVLKLLQSHDTTYFTPGTQFRYSNSGFCLLALIIEKVSHQSYATFIKQKIFMPLHMDESVVYEAKTLIAQRAMGYAKDSSGNVFFSDQSMTSATKGDGGVYTSINDYRKWMKGIQNNTLLNLPKIMQRMYVAAGGVTNAYYSAGWFFKTAGSLVLFHSGSTCGFNNYVITVPAKKFCIVFFSNLAENTSLFRDILEILHQCGFADYRSLFALHELTR